MSRVCDAGGHALALPVFEVEGEGLSELAHGCVQVGIAHDVGVPGIGVDGRSDG